jgi:hypothetical protein
MNASKTIPNGDAKMTNIVSFDSFLRLELLLLLVKMED